MVVAMGFTAFNPSYNLWFIAKFSIRRHREERSDEAIQFLRLQMLDGFASLAMTNRHEVNNYPRARSRRPFSLLQSRFFSLSRLSCSFLPFATASKSLARPRSLK